MQGPMPILTAGNVVTPAQAAFWTPRIRAAIHKSFAGTMETGRLLREAKDAVDHGEWLPLLRGVGLHPRTAPMWMRIAVNPRFANASRDSLLPAYPGALDAISRLPEDVYQRLLAEGVINPTVSKAAIKEQLDRLQQAADEERNQNLGAVAGKVRTLVGDPGWAIMSRGGRACNYQTMS